MSSLIGRARSNSASTLQSYKNNKHQILCQYDWQYQRQSINEPMLKKEPIEKEIKRYQNEISKIRFNLLLKWVSFLFTSYHRCVITIIAEKYFREEPLPIAEIEKFRNGANLLKDLQDGLLVTLVHHEKKAIEVKINREFFYLLPTLIEKMRTKIQPEIISLNRINVNEEVKICKICGTVRSQREIQFIGETCRCDIPSFIIMQKDEAKLAKLINIRSMLEQTAQQHEKVNHIHGEITKLHLIIDKINKRPLTQLQNLVKQLKLGQLPQVQKTPQMIQEAKGEFTRYMRFIKIEELAAIKTLRKRIKKENILRSMNRQPYWFTETRIEKEKILIEKSLTAHEDSFQQTKRSKTYEPTRLFYIAQQMQIYEPAATSLSRRPGEPYNQKQLSTEAAKIYRQCSRKERKEQYRKFFEFDQPNMPKQSQYEQTSELTECDNLSRHSL